MISQVLKEEDLLKEIQEDPRSDESLYKQVAIVLAAEGHEVLLNSSYPSIISDADDRKITWAIVIALYQLGGAIAWDLSNELLNFDTMELEGGLYRHTAIATAFDGDTWGRIVPQYYYDNNKQPVGYSRVATTNPPFYLKVDCPDSPWAGGPVDPELFQEMIKKLGKNKKPVKPRPSQKPKLVKTDPPEPPESD